MKLGYLGLCTLASVLSLGGESVSPGAAGAAAPSDPPKATVAAAKAARAQPPAERWEAPFKNIPLGPGKLDVGFDLRLRYELSDNFDVRRYGTEATDNLLLLRTRLSLDYKLPEHAHVFVEFQDARYELSDLERGLWPVNCPFYDELELRQAYAEWLNIGGSPLGFKAGRQVITYADKRVFGPGEWGNVGRYWWDAAKVCLSTKVAQVDLLYGQRVISEPTTFNNEHFPYQMLGAYAQFKEVACGTFALKPDLFYIVQYDDHGNIAGESGVGDQETHSVGFYFKGRQGKHWDFAGTLAGQMGKYGRDDIEAFGANALVGYTLDTAWTPRIGFEFSYASGDDNPGDGVHGTFDGIFGAVDLYYYGSMNVVSWMNLEDYQLTFSVKPAKTLTLRLDHHVYRLAESRDAWYWSSGRPARRDATGRAGSDLGQEINLAAQWKLGRNFELFGGYGHLFAGEYVSSTPGSHRDADWFFLQSTFKF